MLKDASAPRIDKPEFYGMDDKNQPYTITAEIGEQLDKDNMKLNSVTSDMKLNNGTNIQLLSNQAFIAIDKDIVELSGDIKIDIDKDYTLRTEKAQIHYKDSSAKGDTRVEVTSEKAHIEADSFETANSYDEIIFNNNVKTTLY